MKPRPPASEEPPVRHEPHPAILALALSLARMAGAEVLAAEGGRAVRPGRGADDDDGAE